MPSIKGIEPTSDMDNHAMAQIIILVVKVILICVSLVNNLNIIPIEKEIPDDIK